jgi:hypothetical protein
VDGALEGDDGAEGAQGASLKVLSFKKKLENQGLEGELRPSKKGR